MIQYPSHYKLSLTINKDINLYTEVQTIKDVFLYCCLIMSFCLWTFASLLIEFLIKDGWIPFIKGCFVNAIYCQHFQFELWLMTIEPQPLHSTPHPLWPRQILYLSSIIQGILADPLQSTVWCSFCLHTNILLWRPIFIADDFIWNSTTYYRYLFFILITC